MALSKGGAVAAAAAAGLGIWLLTSSASASTRPPYKKRIPVPGNDGPWDPIDEAICQCFQAGEVESAGLVRCTLGRVYPEVPWPAQPNDDVSVMRTWQAVGFRVANFLKDVADGKDPCAIVEPPDPTDPDPTFSFGDLFDDGSPEHFARIVYQGQNNNPARTVERAYGIAPATANVGRALVCMANVGFNLMFYSRKRNPGTYGSTMVRTGSGALRAYDIGDAWNPWHNRVRDAGENNVKLARGVGWSGTNPVASDHAYGSPWMPPTKVSPDSGTLFCVAQDPWAPEVNPPAAALAQLGWTLAEMKAKWLAGNP